MKKLILLAITHLFAALGGFALGIYLLPILIAPPAPTEIEVEAATGAPVFSGTFQKDLAGSDAFHWGDGKVLIGKDAISLMGSISPGPDYKLYLSPKFVETEDEFNRVKPQMVRVGDVKTFDNFIVPIPDGINPGDYATVVVWCETFGEFISAARYQ